MVLQSNPPAELHAVANFARARYAGERRHHHMRADLAVVADMAEIIDVAALADHSVFQQAPVDARAGPYGNAILDDHAPEMRR
jgi:hypothetical protein